MAIRRLVSGVRNSWATVATRSSFSSSKRRSRVMSWSTTVTPRSRPSSLEMALARGRRARFPSEASTTSASSKPRGWTDAAPASTSPRMRSTRSLT